MIKDPTTSSPSLILDENDIEADHKSDKILSIRDLGHAVSVGRDPSGPHEKVENNLPVVLVQTARVQRLRRLSLLLLEMICE